MNRIAPIACTVSLALFGFNSPAGAALVNGTTTGGKDTVIDTVNLLEWMDVDETLGLSPNAAVAANAAGGFRWATLDDIQILIDAFFAQYPPAPTTYVLSNNSTDGEVITYAQTLAFTDLFEHDGFGETAGWIDDGVDDGNQDTFQISDISATPYIASYFYNLSGNDDGDLSYSYVAVYLVRDIPEPATAALLALGGVALLRRRQD